MVGQPRVARGTQEEDLGGIGHHVPILVHPGDAGRRVGLHQHEEQQEEPSTLDLLVAGICPQDLRLIWATNTGSETGRRDEALPRPGAAQPGAGFVLPGVLVSRVYTELIRHCCAAAAMDAGHRQQPHAPSPHLRPVPRTLHCTSRRTEAL